MSQSMHKVNIRKERGAVLIVSLIVLLVVTLLGLSTMESAVMQERMAFNSQNKNRSFQVTESLLEDALRDEAILGGSSTELHDAIVRGIGDGGDVQSYSEAQTPVEATYQVTYMGENTPFVAEGNETSLSNDIPVRRFELRIQTTNSDTQAGSTHTQGIVPN